MRQLRDAALADDYAFQQVRHLSNNIGPRLSGSAQAAQAVAYVAAEMRPRRGERCARRVAGHDAGDDAKNRINRARR